MNTYLRKVVLALLILLFGLMTQNVFAETILTHRISGENRYATAANIAKEGWPDGSQWAIVAYGGNFPDALASTPLAAKYKAPILLTENQNLTTTTKETLQDLGTKNVIIVGGTGVVPKKIETQLLSMGISVTRLSGSDRYQTSLEIAKQINNEQGKLIVTTGSDYANALSISSYAGRNQIPILLVDKSNVSSDLKAYLASHNIQQTYVIGNENEIDVSVEKVLPNVTRVQGNDKYATNLAVLKEFESAYDFENIFIATGNNFADALAGSSYAAKMGSPIILTGKTNDSRIKNYFTAINPSMSHLNILGGESAIATSLVDNYLGNISEVLTAKEIFTRVSPSVVYIETYDKNGRELGTGSGFIIDSNGKIATNYHVIHGAYTAKVKMSSGTTYDVEKVLSYDQTVDLAILKISKSGLSAVTLGDSSMVETGDNIYAIGNPLGLENTISDGLISAKSRMINGLSLIQISAPISPGSSGGALVNEQGKVIGITAAVLDQGQNLNFAIPVDLLKTMLTEDINQTLDQIYRDREDTAYKNEDEYADEYADEEGITYLDVMSYIQSNYGTNFISDELIKYNVLVSPYGGNRDGSHIGSALIVFYVTADTDVTETEVLQNHTDDYEDWLLDMLEDIQSEFGDYEFNGGMWYEGDFYITFDNWSGEINYTFW